MSLDTLANVKARLGVSGSADDTLLGLLMDSADAWIANHTGRDFGGGTFTEYFSGGAEVLILTNFPVVGVTSIKVDPVGSFGAETIVAATSYVVEPQRGVIQSKYGLFGRCGPHVVEVVYSTATSAVPNDVKQAYARLVRHWYARARTEISAAFENLSEQRFGDVTTTYQLVALPISAEVERLLAPYRTPII